jgi:hypothetical protein
MDVRTCLLKLFERHCELQRLAKRNDKPAIKEEAYPNLWILTTSASDAFLKGFGGKTTKKWGKGIYFFGNHMKAAIVVIDRLPKTPETLWLRLLGNGKTLQNAVSTLANFPHKKPLHDNVLEVCYKWHTELKETPDLTPEDEELLMMLSPAYEKARQKAVQEGQQAALQQTRSEFVTQLLKTKYEVIDDTLLQVLDPLVKMSPEQSVYSLTHLSREELLAQFGKDSRNG